MRGLGVGALCVCLHRPFVLLSFSAVCHMSPSTSLAPALTSPCTRPSLEPRPPCFNLPASSSTSSFPQTEFRVNAKETDPEKVRNHRSIAIKGLSQLQAYTGLVDTDMDWAVTMEPAPLGGLSEEKVEEKLKRVPKAAVGPGRGGEEEGGKR